MTRASSAKRQEPGGRGGSNRCAGEKLGFRSVGAMHFRPSSPFFEVVLKDGNVVRFNCLTGREQRRFLADRHTAAERERDDPNIPYLWEAAFMLTAVSWSQASRGGSTFGTPKRAS